MFHVKHFVNISLFYKVKPGNNSMKSVSEPEKQYLDIRR